MLSSRHRDVAALNNNMVWLLLLLGLFCFLLVLGFFVSDDPAAFAMKSLVVLGALAFISVVLVIGWILLTG